MDFNLARISQVGLWLLIVPMLAMLVLTINEPVHTLHILRMTVFDADIGLGLRVDIISALLGTMITLLGAVVGHYSASYLSGEPRQSYFFRYLWWVVLSSSLLVFSSNMLMFFVMWFAISYNLHKLLTYYSDRPAAVLAARKKFIISRFGDIAVLGAIAITYKTFGTLEFDELFARASQATSLDAKQSLTWIALLLVVGAVTKSAQFPFHFWLPETMETPTPVSALMHAGVINAGGFLIIRMSPLLEHALWAHSVLIVFGTVSAVFGALCMIVQNDIKKKLAYSTISQMGVMMLACGLGLYSIALYHIFSHSFYKAHAFLSTGALIEESRDVSVPLFNPPFWLIAVLGLSGLDAILLASTFDGGQYLGSTTYAFVLVLALTQSLPQAVRDGSLTMNALVVVSLSLLAAIGLYSVAEYGLALSLRTALPPEISSPNEIVPFTALALWSFAMFLGLLFFSAKLRNAQTLPMQSAYLYLRNGGYFDLWTTLLLSKPTSPSAR